MLCVFFGIIVLHGLSGFLRILNLRPGAGTDIPADIDNEDFISHVNLPLVHVIKHFLRAFRPDLIIA